MMYILAYNAIIFSNLINIIIITIIIYFEILPFDLSRKSQGRIFDKANNTLSVTQKLIRPLWWTSRHHGDRIPMDRPTAVVHPWWMLEPVERVLTERPGAKELRTKHWNLEVTWVGSTTIVHRKQTSNDNIMVHENWLTINGSVTLALTLTLQP